MIHWLFISPLAGYFCNISFALGWRASFQEEYNSLKMEEVESIIAVGRTWFAGVDFLHHAYSTEGETNCPMHTRYIALLEHLTDAILTSPGETDPTLRSAIKEQSAQWSSSSPQQFEQVPPELVAYVKKVALYAYKTTEEDIEALRRAGYDEDAIFEITLSAALGAGMTRLERGLAALKGDTNASQKY